MKGPENQYLGLSDDEVNCIGDPGNKGRNYSLVGDPDNNLFWYWNNAGNGAGEEWAMCLFVCDTVTIPVNVPGDPDYTNPFFAYGFDVGSVTVTPLLSSGNLSLGFMTEDYTGLGGGKVVLASHAALPSIGPIGKKNYRIPIGYDALTSLYVQIAGLFMHFTISEYPACMFGTTCGGNSLHFPFPSYPQLIGTEFRYCTFDMAKGRPPSASYMVTYF